MVGVLVSCDRKPRPIGFFIAVICLLYAPARFAMDFLRVEDVRHLGLTPGQYAALALVFIGLVIWHRRPGEITGPAAFASPAPNGKA